MMLLLHRSSLVLTMATDLKLHNKFWEEVRVVVLHVQARQVYGPVAVRDRHQLDHLDTTWHNLPKLAQRELIILFFYKRLTRKVTWVPCCCEDCCFAPAEPRSEEYHCSKFLSNGSRMDKTEIMTPRTWQERKQRLGHGRDKARIVVLQTFSQRRRDRRGRTCCMPRTLCTAVGGFFGLPRLTRWILRWASSSSTPLKREKSKSVFADVTVRSVRRCSSVAPASSPATWGTFPFMDWS